MDNKACFAVIAAEEQELAGVRDFLTDPQDVDGPAGCRFLTGEADGVKVVAMQCGIGKVNAAIGTQVMIDLFHPDALVNIGSAGGVGDGLSVYDIVVAEKTVQHDMDVTGLGYAPGVVPGYDSPFLEADPILRDIAVASGRAEELHVHTGTVASGDAFVSDPELKRFITEQFGALYAEMEGAAVAQTCVRNNVPWTVIRAISDNGDDAAAVSYADFSAQASIAAVRLMRHMIMTWAAYRKELQ